MSNEDTNHVKLIRILVKPFQDVEAMWQQLMWQRNVNDAVGAQLTILGELVGQPRNGITDDEVYRRYVRARIAVNRSRGTIPELINICDLIVFDDDASYVVKNEGTATVRVRVAGIVLDDDIAAALYTFLVDAAAAGVRIILQWNASDPDGIFQYDDGPGFDQGRLASSLG